MASFNFLNVSHVGCFRIENSTAALYGCFREKTAFDAPGFLRGKKKSLVRLLARAEDRLDPVYRLLRLQWMDFDEEALLALSKTLPLAYQTLGESILASVIKKRELLKKLGCVPTVA